MIKGLNYKSSVCVTVTMGAYPSYRESRGPLPVMFPNRETGVVVFPRVDSEEELFEILCTTKNQSIVLLVSDDDTGPGRLVFIPRHQIKMIKGQS